MTFDDFAIGRNDSDYPPVGNYDIPSTIGSGPKFTMRSRHKQFEIDYDPSYNLLPSTLSKKGSTIGRKYYTKKESDNFPGPSYVSTTIGKGPKTSIHNRHPTTSDVTPGPGSYTLPTSTFNGPKYSIGVGKRFDYFVDSATVAPGTYYPKPPMEQRRPMTISSKTPEPFRRKQHPGPMYNIREKIGSSTPKFSFPKGSRDQPIEITPGPLDYQGTPKSTKIGPSLKGRTKVRSFDVNPMPYYDVGTTIKPRKMSMHSRPPTSYETVSPGPGMYDIPSSIVPKKKTIGVRSKTKNPHDEIPSPDSYGCVDIKPKSSSITGFLGSGDRFVVNLKEEAKKPGPGYYDPKNNEISASKKGHKISK
ncbi:h-shippo 1 [Histomonas meleagridis]|uniref:h-shippo 1 n=1 Tax=Histomonas meleagridis TaxID=135588 RepID=UPI00355A8720|nr:h-shippo 1 [Histomonas meleagridis]KAH0803139.1 h-shippo 1 [Histomonas meleagridis]